MLFKFYVHVPSSTSLHRIEVSKSSWNGKNYGLQKKVYLDISLQQCKNAILEVCHMKIWRGKNQNPHRQHRCLQMP